ncbi:integrase core domain-containing protein [Nonomuraea sp. NPDC050790]|uniref:integrase core domain-containing protein n=1 Tax=Nonomuraea sp. NPDC050790 TaxID=3364371 RepID=UPI0037A15FD7
MDLEDAGCRTRFLIRDRDGKFPALMDEILAEAGIQAVLTGIRMPRMNSIMERWVQSCRHELLDRCLIWNEHHLRHALGEYEKFYNEHRAHQALDQAAPLRAVPGSTPHLRASSTRTSIDTTGSAESSTNTHMPLELHGRNFRQAQSSTSTRMPPDLPVNGL